LLSIDHAGVLAEIGLKASDADGPGPARHRFASLTSLYAVMPRLYKLATSLPDAPLQEFLFKTREMPKTTEVERLVVQRVGQDIFRDRLIDYWQGRCPLTGIPDRALLRASHIKPWKDCESDDERLDVHNGLLLSALWDAAFDRGLVTFDDAGHPTFSPVLSAAARAETRWIGPILLTDRHRERLAWHRAILVIKNN
jgi:predicted restriction endonuclease